MVCARSTAPERPGHGEQRRRAAMHARRRCSGHPPANLKVPLDAPRRREHAGAHPVAEDLADGESRPAEARPEWCTADPWGHGPGSHLSVPLLVWIWVRLAFGVGFSN